MITTKLYQVSIGTVCGYEWTGLFIMKPNVHDVDSAIILDIEEASGHDDSMNEDEEEQLVYHIRWLYQIQQIVNNADDEVFDQHGQRDIRVAGVTIGTIVTNDMNGYDAGESEEAISFPDRFPDRYCRDREST
jgi:hypothetical protein